MKKKLKIGILSFPSACNHGAYLQVYALMKYLEEKKNNVSIINYRNKSHYRNEIRSMFVKKDIFLVLLNIIRFRRFRKAQKRFNMGSIIFDHSLINSKDFDVIIIGGDIVWDYNSDFLGHDKIYYGHNLQSKKIITYAASSGNAMSNNFPEYVKTGLPLISSIGVRDSESLSISNLIETKANRKIVLDTTLLYDFPDTNNKKYKQKYILIYAFEITERDREQLLIYAKEHNLEILSITFNKGYKWVNKNFYDIDPLDFVDLIKNASYVFTSTFHGLLFSIKYKKQVALRNNDTIHKKCSWLINQLNLNNLIIKPDQSVEAIFNNDYLYPSNFDESLKILINDSKSFLNDSINLYD